MTRTAAPAALPPVLDFDLIPTGRNVRWTVFNARDGAGLEHGRAATREAATRDALAAIASRSSTRLYVIQDANGFSLWHPRAEAWFPLPLTRFATGSDALRHVEGLPMARGRTVEVCDVARLARSFN